MTITERVKRYREILLGLPNIPANKGFVQCLSILTSLGSSKDETEYITSMGTYYGVDEDIVTEICKLLYPPKQDDRANANT